MTIREYLARRRLSRIVEANRNAPATVSDRQRREAALLGIMRKRMARDLEGA